MAQGGGFVRALGTPRALTWFSCDGGATDEEIAATGMYRGSFFQDRVCRTFDSPCVPYTLTNADGTVSVVQRCLDLRACPTSSSPTQAPFAVTGPPASLPPYVISQPPHVQPPSTAPPATPCSWPVRPSWESSGYRVVNTNDGPGFWFRRCPEYANCFNFTACEGALSVEEAELNWFQDRLCRTFVDEGICPYYMVTPLGSVLVQCLQVKECPTVPTASPTRPPFLVTGPPITLPQLFTLPPIYLPPISTRAPGAAPPPTPSPAPCSWPMRPIWSAVGFYALQTDTSGYWFQPCANYPGCYNLSHCGPDDTGAVVHPTSDNWFGDQLCRVFEPGCSVVTAGANVARCVSIQSCLGTPGPTQQTGAPVTRPPYITMAPLTLPPVNTGPPITLPPISTIPPVSRQPTSTLPPTPNLDAPCSAAMRPAWEYNGYTVVPTNGRGFWLRRCASYGTCYNLTACDGSLSDAEGALNFFQDRLCRTFEDGCEPHTIDTSVGAVLVMCLRLQLCPTESPTRPPFVVTGPPISLPPLFTLPPISLPPIPTRAPGTAPPTSSPRPCEHPVRPTWSTSGYTELITDGPGWWLAPCAEFEGCYNISVCDGSWTSTTMPSNAYIGNFFGDSRCRVLHNGCQV